MYHGLRDRVHAQVLWIPTYLNVSFSSIFYFILTDLLVILIHPRSDECDGPNFCRLRLLFSRFCRLSVATRVSPSPAHAARAKERASNSHEPLWTSSAGRRWKWQRYKSFDIVDRLHRLKTDTEHALKMEHPACSQAESSHMAFLSSFSSLLPLASSGGPERLPDRRKKFVGSSGILVPAETIMKSRIARRDPARRC